MKTFIGIATAIIFSICFVGSVHSQDVRQDNKLDPGQFGFVKEKTGNLTSEGKIANGKKEGNWITYFPTGYINKIEEFHNGMKDGLALEIDSKGTVTAQSFYKADMLDGVSKSYIRGTKFGYIKTYRENKLDGSSVLFYESGIIQENAWYKTGLRDSTTTWYNSEGKKVQSNFYRSGKFDGTSLTYHPNEKVKIEKHYVMDMLNGPYKEFDTSGIMMVSGSYIDGNKKGEWFTYDQNGKVISKEKIK